MAVGVANGKIAPIVAGLCRQLAQGPNLPARIGKLLGETTG